MTDLVGWMRLLFSDCLARAPFGVGWELDRAEPPLVASVTPADMPTRQVRLDRDDVRARIDFACRLQALLNLDLERPVPWCPTHHVGLTPSRAGDEVAWVCPEDDFRCDIGDYEVPAFWPPTEHDRWVAPLLGKRFEQRGVSGIARFSVHDGSGEKLVAKVAVRPEADEQAVRNAAAPLAVEITRVPAIGTVREWRPAVGPEPAHEVLAITGALMRLALLKGTLRRADPGDDCDFVVGDTRVRLAAEHLIGGPGGPLVMDRDGFPFADEGDAVGCTGGFGPPGPVRESAPIFHAGAMQSYRAARSGENGAGQ